MSGYATVRYRRMKRWFFLSLSVHQDLAESISNFLVEKGSTGIEEENGDFQEKRLKAYFPLEGREERILQAVRRYAKSLQEIRPELPSIKIEIGHLPDQDWGENWKRFFKPLRVGSRFIVRPPWARIRMRKNDLPIEINPGMAFGTGTHATTKLCMQAMEKRLGKRNLSVLDVGTGSGILSIAACRLGAAEVWANDIDRTAIEVAKENVHCNGVSDRVRIQYGSIGKIRKRFDLVVANLDFRSLRRSRMALIRHLKQRGTLILSGILHMEEENLRHHYLETDLLKWAETKQEGECGCLTFIKK
jgi:ribosomal protein L11 methyltransferase